MNGKTIKLLVCALLAVLAVSVFASCTESTKGTDGTESTTSNTQSEVSNPFAASFSPTDPGDTSVTNEASGLQEPPKYDPTVTC